MAERGIIFRDDFVTAPDKSWFDMSFDFLLSGNFGELIPTTCMECMPEDKIHAKSDSFVRLAPLVSPTFGKVNMFDYHFYVRNRSIWTQWESFIADKDQRKSWQQANPLWTPPEMPYIDVRQVLFNSLFVDPDNMIVEWDNDQDWIFRSVGINEPSVYYLFLIPQVETVDGDDYIIGFESFITADLSLVTEGSVELGSGDVFTIIPFIPNKTEQRYSNGRYNPFSSGTLFDYLGVDLTGMYVKNVSIFDAEFNNLIPDSLNHGFLSTYLTGPATINRFSDFLFPVSLNLKEFLSSHCIVGLVTSYTDDSRLITKTFDVNGQIKKSSYYDGSYTYSIESTTEPVLLLTDNNETSKISSLPLRAYHSIYIDYFRDQNYISVNPCVDFSRDGNDIDWTQSLDNIFDYLTLNYKAYEHDPYTSALPQAQRGEPVRYMPDSHLKIDMSSTAPSPAFDKRRTLVLGLNSSNDVLGFGANADQSSNANYAVDLFVDLSAATIENLRFANALQKLKEREARSGGRYFELMEAIFGARIDDAKIDRPIFLGGDKTPIQVSEVLQTSATEVNTDQPLGQMAGRAVAIGNDDFIEYVTPDHGFFIEICAVLPRTNYQQGLLPMFTRKVRLDYPMPQFAQLGETQVPQSELWYSASESDDKKPFGYQSRYYDSKYQRDRTSGTFKDALAHWTWSRIFDNAPVAGKAFIEVHPDYRQFAVTDKEQEHVYIHMWHDIQVLRSLPVFGTPKL